MRRTEGKNMQTVNATMTAREVLGNLHALKNVHHIFQLALHFQTFHFLILPTGNLLAFSSRPCPLLPRGHFLAQLVTAGGLVTFHILDDSNTWPLRGGVHVLNVVPQASNFVPFTPGHPSLKNIHKLCSWICSRSYVMHVSFTFYLPNVFFKLILCAQMFSSPSDLSNTCIIHPTYGTVICMHFVITFRYHPRAYLWKNRNIHIVIQRLWFGLVVLGGN